MVRRKQPRKGRERRGQLYLSKRAGVWYLDAFVGNRRVKRSLKTSKLEEAKERRDAELRKAQAELNAAPVALVQTFGEMAERAYAYPDRTLSASERKQRARNLA